MTFDILFDGEATLWPDMNCVGIRGKIYLGDWSEPFVAPLVYWNIEDYRSHWRAATSHLLQTDLPTCLIAEIFGTHRNDVLQWWLFYPDGPDVLVQQQMTEVGSLDPEFDPNEPWASIPSRSPVGESGLSPSEWRIDRTSIALWSLSQHS